MSAASELAVDRDQISAFVEALFCYASEGGHVSLRTFLDNTDGPPVSIRPVKINGEGLTPVKRWASLEATKAARHIEAAVFCPPIATFASDQTAAERDLFEAFALTVECDQGAQAAKATLEALLGPATVTVASGGEWADPKTGEVQAKLHLHWRLTEPATGEDLAKLKEARRRATALVGGDPSNVPMVHPIRWPGSWHRKRDPILAEILELNEAAEIDLHEALERLREARPVGKGLESGGTQPEASPGRTDDRELSDLVKGVVDGEQLHPNIVALAARMVGSGMYPGAVVNTLRGLMEASQAPRDQRWQSRYDDIPRAVSTAEQKYGKREPAPVTTVNSFIDPWEAYPLPVFPLQTLPQVLRDFAEVEALSIGADVSAIAMAALTVCAGAVDQQFAVKLQRSGSWQVRPRLWTMLVGPPSYRKSPVMRACMRPLHDHEAVFVSEYRQQMARFESLKEAGEKPSKPNPPKRFILDDTTPEAVAAILARQDRGILLARDELSGWIGDLDRYTSGKGNASARALFLQAYDGGPRTFDRKGDGSLFVNNLALGMLGGIQPQRLREMGTLTSDGLLQRFIPVMMKRPNLPAEVDDEEPRKRYHDLIKRLASLIPETLPMDEGARAAAAEFRQELFAIEQQEGLGEHFVSFVGKLSGLLGSIALTIHLVDEASATSGEGNIARAGLTTIWHEPVPERDVRAAAKIIREFVLPHGLEMFRESGDAGAWDDLRRIASWILTSDRERIVPSDFAKFVECLRGLGVVDISKRLDPLIAGGWLSEDRDRGGPVRAWVVTPGLRETFAKRREAEASRKAEVVETLKLLRKAKASHGG